MAAMTKDEPMLLGPTRRLRAYLLLERVMMEADGEDDMLGEELAEDEASPLAWLWERLSDDEKTWCKERSPEHIQAGLLMSIATPGFFSLSALPDSVGELSQLGMISKLLADNKIDTADLQAEIAKLLNPEKKT